MIIKRITVFAVSLLCQHISLADDWSVWGGDKAGSRYSQHQQINKQNVHRLQQVWQFDTGHNERYPEQANLNAGFQVNPILLPEDAGQHLVFCTPFNQVIALDPKTGEQRWQYDPDYRLHGYGSAEDPQGEKETPFYKCRGVSYWQDETASAGQLCAHRVITATTELELIALDAKSGQLCPDFGTNGVVDVREIALAKQPAYSGEVRFYNPPVVINDTLVVGSVVRDNHRWNAPSGAVRAFDARSGRLRWEFDPIPRSADVPVYSEWTEQAAAATGGGNVWGMMSVDEQRDLVFLPTSGPSPEFYGGNRPGDNRYSDSIVALRGSSGEVVWHFQLIHHDVWDYDLAAQPVLLELNKEGKPFPAVIQATKTGMLYIFHRETGEPFFAIEERPVPQGGVAGEQLSPTQPFPVKPPPLVRHAMSQDELWGLTGYDRGKCFDKYRDARFGPIFTPPSEEGTVVIPATAGGVNWGSVAIDPATNTLVVNVLDMAHFVQLIPNQKVTATGNTDEVNIMDKVIPLQGTPYHMSQSPVVSPFFTPCIEPPWGKLVAVDLQAGTIKWEVPLGTLDKLMPVPLPLKWGTPTFGGPMVTASGLVFIGATADNRIRAFDISSGEELWQDELPTGAFAHPMSYQIDGEQYVVIAAGGHPFVYRYPGDKLIAYKLGPELPWWKRLFN